MSKIKPDSEYPLFLVSEIMSSDDSNCIPVIFSSREVTIIRQALFPVSYWRTRLGERVGNLFDFCEDEDTKRLFRLAVDEIDYKLGGAMTDCFASLAESINNVADALKIRCCDNSCGDVDISITDGGNTVTGDTEYGPGETEGEGDPPEGFASWNDYFTHKCRSAYFIVDGFINVLNQYSIMSLVGFVSVSAVLGIFLVSFPPATVVLLVAALVALALGKEYLADLSDWMVTNRDEIACQLYLSKTTGEAIDNFISKVDDGIEDLALVSPLPGLVKGVVTALCDGGLFATLFDMSVNVFYPDVDCSLCDAVEGCEFVNLDQYWPAEIEQISGSVYDVTAYYYPGFG